MQECKVHLAFLTFRQKGCKVGDGFHSYHTCREWNQFLWATRPKGLTNTSLRAFPPNLAGGGSKELDISLLRPHHWIATGRQI